MRYFRVQAICLVIGDNCEGRDHHGRHVYPVCCMFVGGENFWVVGVFGCSLQPGISRLLGMMALRGLLSLGEADVQTSAALRFLNEFPELLRIASY